MKKTGIRFIALLASLSTAAFSLETNAQSQSSIILTATVNALTKSGGASAQYGWGEDATGELDPRPNPHSTYKTFIMNHHTGLTFSAHSYYGGIRFYNQTSTTQPLANATMVMALNNGRVGIGTTLPTAALDVRGMVVIENNTNAALYTGTGSVELNRYLILLNAVGLGSASGLKAGGILVSDSYAYANPGKNDVIVKGSIAIGTSTIRANEKLSVNGAIRARTVKVEEANWPDYVFEKKYPLMPLKELKSYIDANKHLPEIPSAAEVSAEGQDLGKINKLLVQKVEELTLYILELNTRLKKLEAEHIE